MACTYRLSDSIYCIYLCALIRGSRMLLYTYIYISLKWDGKYVYWTHVLCASMGIGIWKLFETPLMTACTASRNLHPIVSLSFNLSASLKIKHSLIRTSLLSIFPEKKNTFSFFAISNLSSFFFFSSSSSLFHSLCLSPLQGVKTLQRSSSLSHYWFWTQLTKINKSPVGSKQRLQGEKEEKRGQENQTDGWR